MSSQVLLFSLLSSFVALISSCNVNPCYKDVMKNPGDYVECDMCVCDEACGLKRDDEIYQCYVKADDFGASCKVQITDGWLAGFIIIAVVVFCCICGGCGYFIKKTCCQDKGNSGGSSIQM